ncbi:MAG: hypothetical protein EOM67_08830 [Spirochaetia bacterium]|nr:hypothetical protein [Spirochaetia bacterium]
MFTSLQKRYTAIIIGITTLFLTLLLLINFVLLRSHSITSAEQTSEMIIKNVNHQIDQLFFSIESTIDALSRQKSIQEVDITHMKDQFLSHVLSKESIVRAIYLGTEKGEMYEWGVGPGFIAYTPTFSDDYDPRIRPWYQKALEVDSFALTDPYMFASTDALGVTAVKPVYKDGILIGVLGLDLIISGIEALVDLIGVEKEGRLILLTQDQKILANQFEQKVSPLDSLPTFSYPSILESSESSTHNIYGNEYMVQQSVNNSTGWIIILGIPYDSIFKFSNQNMKIIIFYNVLLMVLLGSIVTIISTRILTDPINEIIDVLKKHEQGEVGTLIKEQKIPEFQMIASTFNTVVEMKVEQEKEMEKQVEKRTNEVISLTKENMRLRIIEEKERIYSNLHDSLGARLTGINISNQVAKVALIRGEDENIKKMLERIEINTSRAILDLKEILLAKDTDIIEIDDFNNFILTYIKDRLDVKQTKYVVEIPNDSALELVESETLSTIMRITEELVTNTLKYAAASKVEISMVIKGGEIHYSYKDNGKGFDAKKEIKKGFGLPGIYLRVERLGGNMSINTKLGKGVTYHITFPLEIHI